ncbi:LamG domain-containing protein [Kitasatospora sp. NPDC048365]|uniref:LamG domain-containing protein n=1 Tax=Kitasatospora sp. NPDC048365 TaxID=3364050 RepID=UPI0037141EF6
MRPRLIVDHTGGSNLTLGPDATVKQVPGGWVFGGRGTAGSYAQALGAVVDTSRSFTVSAWVVNDAASGSRTAVSQGDGAASVFALGREDAGGQKAWVFRVQTGPGAADAATARAAVPGAAVTGEFTLLTAAYDAGQRTVTLYVNGTAAGSAKLAAGPTGGGPLELGRGRRGGAWAEPWAGAVGHVQVFDRAVSAAEAARIKAQGGPGFPATADWLV